jgi:F420-non-reducing hydrogenase large subunit
MASTKALDALFKVEPPAAAKKIRELTYSIFMLEDHAVHVFILGGPDFIVGPTAPRAERNVLGVIARVGREVGLKVIEIRKTLRQTNEMLAGRTIHPVIGLPGGISRPVSSEEFQELKRIGNEAVEFALFTLKVFKDIVLSKQEYVDMITSDTYTHRTYYMGLVDDKGSVNFYDGKVRIVRPDGVEFARFDGRDYLHHLTEHVEPWTYVKFPYLRKVGWKGFVDGEASGILSVAPLARLNVADKMATPRAQEAYEEMFKILGGKPVHHTLANHWARVIEMIYAAERLRELATDPEIMDPNIRTIPTEIPKEGIGLVEAPRGTLIHHYETDQRGVIRKANLIVATQHNSARMALSVDKAARNYIRNGKVDDGMLNMVEMAFRAYDPCHACATHSLPGSMPLTVYVYNSSGKLVETVSRNPPQTVAR